MGGPGEHYAKLNKPDRERQIHDFTHMWNLVEETTNKQNRDRLIDRGQADSPGEGF